MNIVCVGGAPSTGSSLLADLLDSVPGIACGPEFNVFCIGEAYEFDRSFRERAIARERFTVESSYVKSSRFFNERHASYAGLDRERLQRYISEVEDLQGFVDVLAAGIESRWRKEIGVFAEKTPYNITCIERFCARWSEGLFVEIVRDGRAVVASLMRRGFDLYSAALIWMAETARGRKVSVPNFITVHYRDLCASPYEEVGKIAARMGVETTEGRIADSFRMNRSRSALPGVSTWRVQPSVRTVRTSLDTSPRLSYEEITLLENLALFDSRRGVPVCSFAGLLEDLRYERMSTSPPDASLLSLAYEEHLRSSHLSGFSHELVLTLPESIGGPIQEQLNGRCGLYEKHRGGRKGAEN